MLAEGYSLVTGMDVSAAGDLYYNDTVAGIIYKRDTNGVITELVTSLVEPIGLWMSPNDDGFYTQIVSGAIYLIGFDGTVTEIIAGLGGRVTDIALDEAGNFYLAYFDFGLVKKITPDGTVTELATIPGWISYITYANNYIYATGWQSHQVYRIDPVTGEIELIAGTGQPGLVDGDALTTAQFSIPNGILASVTGDTLYVTDFTTHALRRIIGALTVAVEDDIEQPEGFALAQNYPNPFNPVTAIPYTLSRTSHVTITVIDLMGREIATLVSERQAPGAYTVSWDAHHQPSGVYLYRLETESVTQTRRMILLK